MPSPFDGESYAQLQRPNHLHGRPTPYLSHIFPMLPRGLSWICEEPPPSKRRTLSLSCLPAYPNGFRASRPVQSGTPKLGSGKSNDKGRKFQCQEFSNGAAYFLFFPSLFLIRMG